MTDASTTQPTPKRDLLLSLWDSVLREQLPEGMFPWWQKLNALSRDWVKQDSDRPVQEFLDTITNQGQPNCPPPETAFYLRRALKLSQLLDHSFRTDPIDPPWSDDVMLPCAETVAAELKAAGHRPLRARPFPPYPQLTLNTTTALDNSNFANLSTAGLHSLSERIRHWVTPESVECPQSLTKLLRGDLVQFWQTSDRPLRLWESEYGYWINQRMPEWRLSNLAAFNDGLANTLHIDPRFANFVPFATQHVLYQSDPSMLDPAVFLSTATMASRWALQRDFSDMIHRLEHRLRIDPEFARIGTKGRALHARLSTVDPKYSIRAEQLNPGLPLAQVASHIEERAMRRGSELAKFEESLHHVRDTLLGQGSIPPIPPSEDGPAYRSSSQLLLDLKRLHQSVGETYGGVAFAPEVRRLLILAGECRLHGRIGNLYLDAATVEDVASELALRAGLLKHPLASLSDAAAEEAAVAVSTNPKKLASVFDAGGLSEQARETLGYLRAIRWLLAHLDSDAVNCVLLANVTRASEVVAALSLFHAVDLEPMTSGSLLGNGVADRVGLVIGLCTNRTTVENSRLIRTILDTSPAAAYVQSRGGHVEIMLQGSDGELKQGTYSGDSGTLAMLRLRAHAREAVRACSGVTVTFTLVTSNAWDMESLIACFPPDTLNQHLRVIVPSDTARIMSATTHAVRQLFDAPLAELTRQSWLNRTPETPSDLAAEANALTAIESASQALLADHAAAGVTPESHPDWFAAIEPWFGIEHLAHLPKPFNPANRFPAVALDIAADAMHRHHPRSLSMLAWRTLPKGAYSRIFPAIERAWHAAQSAIDSNGHWPKSPSLTATLANADAILAMLPQEDSN